MDLTAARKIALAWAKRTLGDDPPLAAAPWGWESDARFLVIVDSLAALPPDPDGRLSLADGLFLVVEKASEKVDQIGWETALALQDDTPLVGDLDALAAWSRA